MLHLQGVPLSSNPEWKKRPLQPRKNAAPATTAADCDKATGPSEIQKHAIEQTCFTDMACPTAHVSAFCRAVISKVIPHGFWGCDHNRRIIMYWIDQFVCLRRFESLSLHQVTQKLQVRCT